jgi:hypothetical protein
MRGEWNGLQALVSNDCPYAYYIHCFAHRLQLALVAASKEVIHVHHFFINLSSIVNMFVPHAIDLKNCGRPLATLLVLSNFSLCPRKYEPLVLTIIHIRECTTYV